jgi:hypothetical protein
MKIYKYKNYKEYVEAQSAANKKKLKKTWAQKRIIEQISDTHKAKSGIAHNILCHGTRNGKEQEYFLKFFPRAYVIGTEIADTAAQFKNTVQHDFHEAKSEWINKFDILYSNSWDHSYDPEKSLNTWTEQLNDHGSIYIEHAISNNKSTRSDPLSINEEEILILFKKNNLLLESIKDTPCGWNKNVCKIYTATKNA